MTVAEVNETPSKIAVLPNGEDVRIQGEYQHIISFGVVVKYDETMMRYEIKPRSGDNYWAMHDKVLKHGYYPVSKNPDDIELPMTFIWGDYKPKCHRMHLTHPAPTFVDGKTIVAGRVAEVVFTPRLLVVENSTAGDLDGKGIAKAIMDCKHFKNKRGRRHAHIRDITKGDPGDPKYQARQVKIKAGAELAAAEAEQAELQAQLAAAEAENVALKKETQVNINRAEKAKADLKELRSKTYSCPFPGCKHESFTKGPPGPRLSGYRRHVKDCKHGPVSDAERQQMADEAEGWQLPKLVGDPDLDVVPFGKLDKEKE